MNESNGYDFVPTHGNRGQRHPRGLVNNIWRIKDPETVRMGHCFLKGRIKEGDLFMCIKHSGDCFQTYCFVEEYSNCLIVKERWSFGSYGIGDAEIVTPEVEVRYEQ